MSKEVFAVSMALAIEARVAMVKTTLLPLSDTLAELCESATGQAVHCSSSIMVKGATWHTAVGFH